ncbi:MAG: IPT/TIG domain-containing protein [Bryobacteraceae bacterium]
MTLWGQFALQAQVPPTPLTLQISVDPAPAGGWAQIKIFAASPALITAGSISMNLDAMVFGDIAQVAVFSATGDSTGYATVTGQQVQATFYSSGGIGQLPELPILVLTVPVISTAAPGATTQITLDPTGSTWTDPLGNPYSVTVTPAQFTVGGSLSVESITPGGGLFAAGTVVKIDGAGFDASTQVSVDGVSLSSVQFVSPKEIDVTLGGATEMTGKHFHFASASGAAVDYYAGPPSAPSQPPAPFQAWDTQATVPNAQPLLGLPEFTAAATGNSLIERVSTEIGYALLNPNAVPVTVTFQTLDFSEEMRLGNETLVIPANTLYFLYMNDLINSLGISGTLWITASAPIKGLDFEYSTNIFAPPPAQPIISATPLGLTPSPYFPQPLQLAYATPISWSWQQGTPPPSAATVSIAGNFPFQVSVPASSFIPSGINWLNVTPTSGTGPATLVITPNLVSLKPGFYSAAISVTPVIPASLTGVLAAQTVTISVSLTVSAAPLLSWSGDSYFPAAPGSQPTSNTVTIGSNGSTAAFKAAAASTGNWLSVSPASGSTPANLTLTANPGQLPDGYYTGAITVAGPANTLIIPVTMQIYSLPPNGLSSMPAALSFALVTGTATEQYFNDQDVAIEPLEVGRNIQFSASTSSGGNWLSVSFETAGVPSSLDVNASAAGLQPGTFQGTINVTSTGYLPLQIPVTLVVLPSSSAQTAITVTPASLSLTAPAGQAATQSIQLNSGATSTFFTVTASPSWLQATGNAAYCENPNACITPATVTVSGSAGQLGLGTYTGMVAIQWATGSLTVPVSFTVTSATSAGPAGTPVMAGVVNGASLAPGAIAPGEIVTVTGTAIGPYPTSLQIGASGKIATALNGAQLFVDGIAAPLLYASTGQLNAIVPYEIETSGNATVQVKVNGQMAASWDVPLAPSAPAIFTVSASGVGQAAVLNQDNTVNSPSNPAAPGSVIQIFATGEGVTSPASVTGAITGTETNMPILPVSVSIGGIQAAIEYDGSAPDAVAGLFQVNALVPLDAPTGSAVPIALKIGGAQSPTGVTIAVR